MTKYKLGQVGITRHPEIYVKKEEKVFTTAEEELRLWKNAEKVHKKLKKFNDYEFMFIMHYVMALREIGDYQSIMLHEFMKTKIIESRTRQAGLELLGSSARQLSLLKLQIQDKMEDQIANDPDIEDEMKEEKKK